MKITKTRWLSGMDNKTFSKLLILYDNNTYEEVKVKLHGKNTVRFWYWVEPWELDPYEGWGCDDLTYRQEMSIHDMVGLTKTDGRKFIKQMEERWKTQIKRADESLKEKETSTREPHWRR